MTILGYFLAVLMGATLGLIGAGGSILTVPILVYFFKIPPLTATAYSLLIVGSTALIGAVSYYKKNLVKIKSAAIFATPATISVLCTRALVLPNLPSQIFGAPKEIFVMLLFAALMLLAALFMLKPPKIIAKKTAEKPKALKLVFGSAAIGFLTGMVGAGGGFLIIPTLIALFGLSMKEAIGTSLAIIAANSLISFKGDLILNPQIDWQFLALFIFLTAIGMLGGVFLSKYFDAKKLKKIFAIFVACVALAIFAQETLQLLNSTNF
jgi:uncharacterized protein